MKKVLTLLLALALVVCMIPASAVTAFAEDAVTLTEDMISISSLTYTGQNLDAASAVTVKNGDVTYTKDTEYSIAFDKTVKEAGEYTVTITGLSAETGNKLTGTVNKKFTVAAADLTKIEINYTGSTLKSNFTGFDSLEVGGTVTLASGTVQVTGIADGLYDVAVTKLNADQFRIAVSAKDGQGSNVVGNTQFKDVTLTTAITKITSDNAGKVETIADQTYTGSELKPTVYVWAGDTKLTSSDYTLTYTNNVDASGYATITAVGTGKYSGTLTKQFAIVGKNINKCTITADSVQQNAKSAKITIKDGSNELKEGTDYTLTNLSTANVGTNTGSVTINGCGNYSGTLNKTFTVTSSDNVIVSVDWSNERVMYTGSSQSVGVSNVKTAKGDTISSSNYKVTYTQDGKTVTPKNVGTYTAVVTGTGNYSGTKTTTFIIRPYTLDNITVSFGSTVYNKTVGKNVPSVTVKGVGTSNVIPSTDYSVLYYGFSSTYGTKGVTITPVKEGEYATDQYGSKSTTASTGALTTSTSYTTDRDFTYDGTVSDVDTGNVTVTIDKVYYKDSNNKEQKLTVKSNSVDYVGEKLYVDFTVYDKDARTYLSDSYYNVTYKDSNNKSVSYMYEADTYKITISSTSSYERKYNRSFSVTKTFTVGGTSISNYTVVLSYTSINATGSSQKLPTITKVYRGSDTLSTSEYTATYKDSNNKTISSVTNPGTYTVKVTGKGAYSGSTSATFYVVGKTQKVTWLDDEGETYEYQSYRTYPGKELQLNAKATDGTITYSSSDSSIASVDKYGVVTAYKAGRAKITATVSGSKTYSDASASIVIKVYPTKGVLTQKPWKSNGKVKVRWNKQENVTRYEVRYSRDKNFTTGTYLTKKVNAAENDFTTQSTSLTGLKSGAKYYVKVRAVKEVYNDNGKKLTYYGKWSNWRSVRA